MSDYISKNSNIGKILTRKEFSDFSRVLLPFHDGPLLSFLKMVNLSFLGKLSKTWNVEDMADGLNRMIDLSNNSIKTHYEIWSDEEKAADPRKVDTALFHFPVKKWGPSVLICPGGAYMGVASIMEGFPIAASLNKMGYSAFVLHYRTGKENPWHAPMEDLQQALHFILDHSDEFNIDNENYAVAGFSAGGHLTASLGTDNYGYKRWNLRKPNALILGYPATIFDHMTRVHKQAMHIVLGKKPTKDQIDSITIINHIDRDFPPTFVWQCEDDDVVYFENSERLAGKLKEVGIPHRLKVVSSGGHGLGLGNGTLAQGWLTEAVQFWLKR